MRILRTSRLLAAAAAAAALGLASGALGDFPTCGPFSDVSGPFCPFVLEIFYLGITTGTTPTTYSPNDDVTRLQMAAFLSRTVDGTLRRGGRRAILNKFWTPKTAIVLGLTTVGSSPSTPACDGRDVWVPNNSSDNVTRVRASDGRVLETWTGATGAVTALSAMGNVFVTGYLSPSRLYRIDPSQPVGFVTTVASNLSNSSNQLAFDGDRLWAAGQIPGAVSIVTPGPTIPWTVTTVTAGFANLEGILYDGSNIWVTDYGANKLLKLSGSGAVLQTVTLPANPSNAIFDGTNIWITNPASSITVVRASSGAILGVLTGNGMNNPEWAAFDGQRVLVSNNSNASVSLWKAADLSPLGSTPTGAGTFPDGACSDGLNFWVSLGGADKLAKF